MSELKEKVKQIIDKDYAKKLVLDDSFKEMERFFDRFPDLLWDDPEDRFNEIIGVLRSKVMDYYKIVEQTNDDSLYANNSEMLAKIINEVLDCYFLHRSEGLLEAAMRLERVSKELGIIK